MSRKAEDIIEEVESEKQSVYDHIREAAEWFHEREGEMFERQEAENKLSKYLDVSSDTASELITELVSDEVDPVVQINSEGNYVGIIEYKEFEDAYGYIGFDDVRGKNKKMVCARCVEKSDHSSDPAYIQSENTETEYKELNNKLENHKSKHEKTPQTVKTGATLAAGTTVGGNRVATRNWVDGAILNNGLKIGSGGIDFIDASDIGTEFPDGGVFWPDQGGGRKPVIYGNGKGEIDVIDDKGNRTNLTNVRGGTVVISGEDYEIQKNGSDTSGVINFKT